MIARIIKRSILTEPQIEELYQLHKRFFDNSQRSQFIADLSEKDWVIELSSNDQVVGFSTAQFLQFDVHKKRIGILYSGDTIVDSSCRRTSHLPAAFHQLFDRFSPDYDELYWLLICKGHRTYRMLPTFFNRFYPSAGSQHDATLKPLLDIVAQKKFANAYSPMTGVISYAQSKDCLKPTEAKIPDFHQQDPHVQLFLQRNPGYLVGDELACLAPLTTENLNPLAKRITTRIEVSWAES